MKKLIESQEEWCKIENDYKSSNSKMYYFELDSYPVSFPCVLIQSRNYNPDESSTDYFISFTYLTDFQK